MPQEMRDDSPQAGATGEGTAIVRGLTPFDRYEAGDGTMRLILPVDDGGAHPDMLYVDIGEHVSMPAGRLSDPSTFKDGLPLKDVAVPPEIVSARYVVDAGEVRAVNLRADMLADYDFASGMLPMASYERAVAAAERPVPDFDLDEWRARARADLEASVPDDRIDAIAYAEPSPLKPAPAAPAPDDRIDAIAYAEPSPLRQAMVAELLEHKAREQARKRRMHEVGGTYSPGIAAEAPKPAKRIRGGARSADWPVAGVARDDDSLEL